jgi:alkylhydroperoxidase family enzyme
MANKPVEVPLSDAIDGLETYAPRLAPEFEVDDQQSRLLSMTVMAPSTEPLNLFRVLVRYPELMKRVNALGGLFMAHGSLAEREREIVILRVAWNTRCEYEFAQHAPIGRQHGLTEGQIRDLGRPLDLSSWTDSDRDLILFVDESMTQLEVADRTWDLVLRSHTEEQMMELVLLIGFYVMLAAFLKTARVPLEEGSVGFPET